MQQKMFLIKKSSGIIYNFYFAKSGGICYKLYSLYNNEKVEPFEISITDEKILEFYVTIDAEDNIYILCLTEDGDLKYYMNKENIWNSKVLSHFDLRSNIVKSLSIHVANKKLYIVYAASNLMNVNLWTIYFKSWDGTKWLNTNIGMTICDKELPPYCAVVDYQNNIHLVYKNTGNRGTQIFYRKFHMQFSLWNTPEKIVNSPENIGFYYFFSGTNNQLHLVWTTSSGNNFKLLYKKLNTKVLNNKHFDRTVTLNMSNHAYLQPVIFEVDKKIWVMWKSQGEFQACEIESSGLSCSSIVPVQCPSNAAPVLIEFTNNYEIEKQSFSGRLLYGLADDFIDLILPRSYSCDFYENMPSDLSDVEPEEFIPTNHSPKTEVRAGDLAVTSKQEYQVVETPTNSELLPVKISEKFEEVKLDNQKVVKILEEMKEHLENRDMAALLKEIRTQNSLLMELITKKLDETTSLQASGDNRKNSALKRMLDIFR